MKISFAGWTECIIILSKKYELHCSDNQTVNAAEKINGGGVRN